MGSLPTPDQLLAALSALTECGRPEYDGDHHFADNGFCMYCSEIKCDPECPWETARALLVKDE